MSNFGSAPNVSDRRKKLSSSNTSLFCCRIPHLAGHGKVSDPDLTLLLVVSCSQKPKAFSQALNPTGGPTVQVGMDVSPLIASTSSAIRSHHLGARDTGSLWVFISSRLFDALSLPAGSTKGLFWGLSGALWGAPKRMLSSICFRTPEK